MSVFLYGEIMFHSLTDKLGKIFEKLSGRGILTEDMLNETLREIRIVLLEADVALPVVKDFIAMVKEQAIGQNIIKSVKPSDMIIKIVNDALIETFGQGQLLVNKSGQQIILMVGLQGSGKTTTSAKLAYKLKKSGQKVLLASCDCYRPGAKEQLRDLANSLDIDCLEITDETAIKTAHRALDMFKRGGYDVLIMDSAGRLAIDEEMMQEIKDISEYLQPHEKILVVDALMGQDAVNVVKVFHETLNTTGTILTRIDGDSRGGVALSMSRMTGQPIYYLGTGEKTDALETFDAKRMAGRILGMGDVVGLVEIAQEKINQAEMEKQAQRMMSGQFDLNDLLKQIRQIQKMGDLKGFMMMIPGMSKLRDKVQSMDTSIIKKQEAIILSMTPKERKKPEILKASRKIRIAKGAGVDVAEVNRLLKSFEQMEKTMKMVKKMGPLGMMNMMKSLGKNPLGQGGGGFPPL